MCTVLIHGKICLFGISKLFNYCNSLIHSSFLSIFLFSSPRHVQSLLSKQIPRSTMYAVAPYKSEILVVKVIQPPQVRIIIIHISLHVQTCFDNVSFILMDKMGHCCNKVYHDNLMCYTNICRNIFYVMFSTKLITTFLFVRNL